MTKTITYSILLLTIAVISLSTTLSNQQAFAATLDLTGTVRDFHDSHPDFEGVISGVVTGLVNQNLAGDKKPDYVGIGSGSAAAGAITSTTTFDQWYVDVGGVNVAAPLTITLDNTITLDPNVFTFSDSSFFPIDGQLFGNEGNSHNYHFTYEIHSEFTYNGGETFSFTGDDDLWVFINDKLAIDIGGVHPAASGSVDLDAAAASLGLTIGETFDFDLFFAERHLVASNFRIDTSIIFDPCQNLGGDTDGDGVCDDNDNCPANANADQTDDNNNGIGDVCDFCTPDTMDLIAGQTIVAGDVTIINDGTTLFVTIQTQDGWSLTESHLQIGDSLDGFPLTKKGNPKVGNFDHQEEHALGTTEFTYEFLLADLGLDPTDEGTITIAVHAVVVQIEAGEIIAEETAWKQGERFVDKGNWAMFNTYDIQNCLIIL